jgi:chaperonin cofactor prefoldin
MAIFDNIAKAAKDFFVESDGATAPSPPQPRPLPGAAPTPPLAPQAAAGASTAAFAAPAPGVVTQPEQRHTDHINSLLAGDGKDFVAYTKMVKSMAASGLSGPVLYQTAFNAFAAVTGLDAPTLLSSAEQFRNRLEADRNKVLERHREKVGEIKIPNTRPSVIAQLTGQEQQLQADLTELTRQLEVKSQALKELQQQLSEERQKAQAALASYELANAAATADLQAHQQAAHSFLLGISTSTK